MTYSMKAQFFPAKEPKDGYIGSASLTVASAILIRGIAVYQENEASNLSLSFPAFGPRKMSYVFPVNRDAYRSMLRVITSAVRSRPEYISEMSGTEDISLSVTGDLVNAPNADGCFSLCIDGLCQLNGITTRESPYWLPDNSNVSVDMPLLVPHQMPKGRNDDFRIFQGLSVVRKSVAGIPDQKDYDAIITDLVRSKRLELMRQHDYEPHNPSRTMDIQRGQLSPEMEKTSSRVL